MDTPRDKKYTNMFETIFDHNDCHNTPLSIEKRLQAVSRVIVETEEGKRDAKNNANNLTMDTFLLSPVAINTQWKDANVTN